MRKCSYCKVNIGGNLKACPLCQSKLSAGQAGPEEPYFPKVVHHKGVSILLKILVFVVLAAVIGSRVVDTRIIKTEHYHFSKPIIMYAAVVLPTAYTFYKNHKSIPMIIFRAMVIACCTVAFTGLMFDIMELAVWVIVPLIVAATVLANFVFCFVDVGFSEDSLICILLNVIIGFTAEFYFMIRGIEMPFWWAVNKIICMTTFVAIVIFKGRRLYIELVKRLNI